jgi:hypothetical protein
MRDEGTQGPEVGNGPSRVRSKKGIGCLLALLAKESPGTKRYGDNTSKEEGHLLVVA